MIIALTGTIGSGKGEAAEHLKKKKYQYLVYSDILREVAERRGIEATRANLHILGKTLKEEERDPGFLTKLLLTKISKKNAIVDGVRNVGEIKRLKREKEAFVIGVTASQRVRFKRILSRKREGDPTTFDAFKKIDNIENRGKTKGQEINACLEHADVVIVNDGTLEKFHKKLDAYIESLTKKQP